MCGKNEHKHVWENARVEGDNLQHCHFSSHRPGGRKSLEAGGRFLPAGEDEGEKGEEMHQKANPCQAVVDRRRSSSQGTMEIWHNEMSLMKRPNGQ